MVLGLSARTTPWQTDTQVWDHVVRKGVPLPLVLSLGPTEKSLSLPSLLSPSRCLFTMIRTLHPTTLLCSTLLAHGQLVHLDTQLLSYQAAFQLACPQHIFAFAFPFAELHGAPPGQLRSLWTLLLFCTICRLAEGSIIQIINGDVKQYWCKFQTLWYTTIDWPPSGLHAADHNALSPAVQPAFCSLFHPLVLHIFHVHV